MLKPERKKGLRSITVSIDLVHIAVGILIVILAVISFLNPENHMLLLPLIFLLAATLNIVNGIHVFRRSGRENKKKINGIFQMITGILLVVLSVVSAVSIWRG